MKHTVLPSTFVLLALAVCCQPPLACAGDQAEVAALRKALSSGDDNARYQALGRLQELGPIGAAAAPDLVKLFADKDEDLRLHAAIALGKIGQAAVPELKAPLTSTDEDERYYALSAVGWIGPAAKELAPIVVASLNHPSASVRRKAAIALGSIAAAADQAVAALAHLLPDADADVRQAAGEALARYGVKALPVLLRVLDHPEIAMRIDAIRILGAIGPEAKDAVPQLRTALFANDFQKCGWNGTSAAAANALVRIGKDALPALRGGVKHQHADVRRLAVTALGQAGSHTLPLLLDALTDDKVDVRQWACWVLSNLRLTDQQVVLALANALKDKDSSVAHQAAEGLLALGAAAQPATAHLLDALKDRTYPTRTCVVRALVNIKPNSPDVFKKLSQLAKDREGDVRQGVMQLLPPFGADALPLVLAGLKDGDEDVRFLAAAAVAELDCDVRATLPLLIPMLKLDNKWGRRCVVVAALGRVGEAALPLLIDHLKDSDNRVRWAALEAVKHLGLAAAKAIPALVECLKDEGNENLPGGRYQVADVLFNLGPKGQAALLAGIQDHLDSKLRYFVIDMLNRTGPMKRPVNARVVVPFLIASINKGPLHEQWQAVRALGSFGPEAKTAIPALVALLEPGSALRSEAEQALKLIRGK